MWTKDKWQHCTDRAKSGSRQAAINEPGSFHIMNPIFLEAKLILATKADDLMSSENEEDSDGETADRLSEKRVHMKVSILLEVIRVLYQFSETPHVMKQHQEIFSATVQMKKMKLT